MSPEDAPLTRGSDWSPPPDHDSGQEFAAGADPQPGHNLTQHDPLVAGTPRVNSAHVTFIVATYNRPDALLATLRSVVAQSHQNWTALVIGDHCSDKTATAVRSLNDHRVRYYNLPNRFGEQSGPNSFGLHIAPEHGFLTFLNHDDLLLPDHIAYALDELSVRHAEFFIGKAGLATSIATSNDGCIKPIYSDILPSSTVLADLVLDDAFLFDPSSFWLVRSTAAKTVGPWRPASTLWRSPLRDWIMRAWRQGFKFCFGEKITGLKTKPEARVSVKYSTPSPDLRYMASRIETETVENLRAQILEEIEGNTAPQERRFMLASALAQFRFLLAILYLRCNFDAANVWYRALGRPRGSIIAGINQRRIGGGLPGVQAIPQSVLADPESCRSF